MAVATPAHTLLAAARQAAVGGRYREAEHLLNGLPPTERGVEAELLAGRIAAQQGRLEEALDAFRRALLAEPGNRDAQAGLQRVRALQRRPLPGLWLRARGLGALGALVILATLALLAGLRMAGAPGPPADPPPVAVAPPVPPAVVPMPIVPPGFEVPGVEIDLQPGVLTLRFAEGLFPPAQARPTRQGEQLLRRLALRLAAHPELLPVTIEGHTDPRPLRPGGPFPDNGDLALARAVTVARLLRQEGKLAADLLLIRSSGSTAGPFPQTDPENQGRNRTVVLRLTGVTAARPVPGDS